MSIDLEKYKLPSAQAASATKKREKSKTPWKDRAMGLAQSELGLVTGAFGLLQSGGQRVMAALDPTRNYKEIREDTGFDFLKPETETGKRLQQALEPKTSEQAQGKIAGDIAQYFVPAGHVGKATQGLNWVTRTLARTAPDIGIAAAQSQGDTATTATAGATSAVANALLPGKPVGMLSNIGRGMAPGYVADVGTGLTGARGEDRTGANAFVPGFGTLGGGVLGAGTGALTSRQQSQQQMQLAVDELESKYQDINRGWVRTRKASDKARQTTKAKDRAGTQGRTPERVLAESGIVPQLEGSKFSTRDQAERLRSTIAPLHRANRKALQEASYSTQPVLVDDLEREAIRRARSSENIASGDADKLVRAIKKEMQGYRENYGDTISLIDLDDIKSARWTKTGFSLTKDDKLAGDVDYLIGKSAQKRIEDVARDAGAVDVAQLNRDIGDIIQASKFLENLDGRAVLYGRMGTHMMRLAGAVAGSGGGALGSVAGAMGGDVLAGLLRSNSIATPVKRLLLAKLEATDPAAYQRTLNWLRKEKLDRELRLALPKPRFIPLGENNPRPDASSVRAVPAQSQGNLPSATNEYAAQTTTANSMAPNPGMPKQNTKTGTNASNVIPKATAAQERKVSSAAQKEALRELDAFIETLEEAVSNAPIKAFATKMGRGDNSLYQLQENAIKRGTSKQNINRYSDVDELGYKDMDDAQEALEQYQKDKERLAQMKQARRELRDQIKRGEDPYAYDNPAFYDDTEAGLVGGPRNVLPRVVQENPEVWGGGVAGGVRLETDEEGNVTGMTIDPAGFLAGIAGMSVAKKAKNLTGGELEWMRDAANAKLPFAKWQNGEKVAVRTLPQPIKNAFQILTGKPIDSGYTTVGVVKNLQNSAKEIYDTQSKKLAVTSKTDDLLTEARKYDSAEEFVSEVESNVKKVTLPPGKDRQFISELYQVGDTDIYIGYKKTGNKKTVEIPVTNSSGKQVGTTKERQDIVELKVFERTADDENYANAFTRANGIETSEIGTDDFVQTLRSQLEDIWKQVNK